MSFDIECLALQGFPIAERDPVITICAIGKSHGRKEVDVQLCLQKGSCDNVVGADLRTFDDDKDLIEAFSEFMIVYDPDVITGYNMITFDLAYLINRARKLKIPTFTWGRLKNQKT